MWRRLRWVLLALVVALVAALATAVVVEKPTLDDDQQTIDTRWAALRDPLGARYATLDGALAALEAIGQRDRAVAVALADDLAAWNDAVDDGSETEQVEAANRLEGTAARLRANVLGSARLAGVTELADAIGAFGSASPPEELVRAYNRAVRTYESDRTDAFRQPVALAFGFEARPLFVVVT
jgi:hypothetical protein